MTVKRYIPLLIKVDYYGSVLIGKIFGNKPFKPNSGYKIRKQRNRCIKAICKNIKAVYVLGAGCY